jgi:hypothetical protein
MFLHGDGQFQPSYLKIITLIRSLILTRIIKQYTGFGDVNDNRYICSHECCIQEDVDWEFHSKKIIKGDQQQQEVVEKERKTRK